ncbi:MAG: family 1 glycosylhydrolase [Patescibacteria group bacterium]|nr:family 1 glycosylhydrolase [Patescibacteria group bacterium]
MSFESTPDTTPDNGLETNESAEKEPGLGIEFYVTDHNLRYPERSTPEKQSEVYAEMKKHGIDSVRFDVDWRRLVPDEDGVLDESVVEEYAEAMRLMQEAGLKPPTIVASTPPEWAQKLYDGGQKDRYFAVYDEYADAVARIINRSGSKASVIQMFNEINHAALFKFVRPEDLPRLADILRDKLKDADPDAKLSTSLIVANTNEKIGAVMDKTIEAEMSINGFLDKYEDMLKETFDVISLDYYPGIWHMPMREADDSYKDTFKQLDMLKNVCEKLSSWNKEYEIGEVGFPTNTPWQNEKRQRYFYDTFFRAFRSMVVDFKERDVKLPSRVGLYETEDEQNVSFGGFVERLLRMPGVSTLTKLTPNPEGQFGLRTKSGEPKAVIKGRKFGGQGAAHYKGFDTPEEGQSQLARIIKYVNRPVN